MRDDEPVDVALALRVLRDLQQPPLRAASVSSGSVSISRRQIRLPTGQLISSSRQTLPAGLRA
jgi:hypothetical protein